MGTGMFLNAQAGVGQDGGGHGGLTRREGPRRFLSNRRRERY